jgi:hypothetical protein
VLTSSSNPSRAGDTSVGVFFPRHSGDRASDTPVANPSLHPQRFVELPRRCLFLCLRPSPAFLRVGRDRRMWGPPSPPIAPSRESRCLVLDWDAFYRQGPFVGSGSHYSSGPATRSPLLAMVEPLSGTLAPPWVFVRTCSVLRKLRPETPTYFSLAVPARRFHLRPFTSS